VPGGRKPTQNPAAGKSSDSTQEAN